jgi:flagellar basal-body rod protein FlgB
LEITNLLERALNIRAQYHKVLAANIANIDTPGYREKDIDFKAELGRSSEGLSTIDVKEKIESEGNMDGNSVNMENQIIKLTENTMMFNSLVQLVNKRFSMMKYIINGGGR